MYAFIAVSLSLTSCSDDHDDHGCQECHIALMMQDGTEYEHEIGEFCDEALTDVESNGYTLDTEFTHMGTTYEVGHVFTADEVHCEEHGDHDHE